jgi:hypothetical protein
MQPPTIRFSASWGQDTATRLERNGVSVQWKQWPGLDHELTLGVTRELLEFVTDHVPSTQ